MTEKEKISAQTRKALDLFDTEKFSIRNVPDYDDIMKSIKADSRKKRIGFNQVVITLLFLVNIISAVAIYTYTSDSAAESQEDAFQKEYYLNYSNYYYLI